VDRKNVPYNARNPFVLKVILHVEQLYALPPLNSYIYHNLDHTRSVVAAIQLLANDIDLPEEEKEIGVVAAWLHDIGHVGGSTGHEERSARMAREFLTGIGYPSPMIDRVCDTILATRLPQNPRNELERLICDADLSYLGTSDALRQAELLREEWEMLRGKAYGEEEWLRINIGFFDAHQYHTNAARKRYEKIRAENLQILKKKLSKVLA